MSPDLQAMVLFRPALLTAWLWLPCGGNRSPAGSIIAELILVALSADGRGIVLIIMRGSGGGVRMIQRWGPARTLALGSSSRCSVRLMPPIRRRMDGWMDSRETTVLAPLIPSVLPSIVIFIRPSVRPPYHLHLHPSILPSVRPSVRPSVFPSICIFLPYFVPPARLLASLPALFHVCSQWGGAGWGSRHEHMNE